MLFLNLFNLNLNETQRMCQAVNYADFKDNHGELYLKVNKNIIELEIRLIVFCFQRCFVKGHARAPPVPGLPKGFVEFPPMASV